MPPEGQNDLNTVAVASAPRPLEECHVTARHSPGSIEHFYHFLLGFFVPLVHWRNCSAAGARYERLIVRSCGPLNHLLQEFVGDSRIEIVDKSLHGRMVAETSIVLQGADHPSGYDERTFRTVREILLSDAKISADTRDLADSWPARDGRILLVQRGRGPDFYASPLSEHKGSGQDRRSIANHDELFRSLRGEHPGCMNVVLEEMSLGRQVALFSLADVIIAQHGAALANIIWARRSATVIEIFPNTLPGKVQDDDLFGSLSRCMGLRYRRIRQEHAHAAVDVAVVRAVVGRALASPPGVAKSHLASVGYRWTRSGLPIKRGSRWFIRRLRSVVRRVRRVIA